MSIENCFLSGEGDNRVLSSDDLQGIWAIVESMVKTGGMSEGYVMSIGNHIPWNVPAEGTKRYLDLTAELAFS